MEKQLYIDNVLMDLYEKTDITLDLKSNLFTDVSQIESNHTYTINLPKTAHNLAVFENADKPKASTSFPYTTHDCRYIVNGVIIINGGKASVSKAADDIEITIYWGLFPALTELQAEDLNLCELETDERIDFYKSNTANTYQYAKEHGVFYASYDPFRAKSGTSEWNGNCISQNLGNLTLATLFTGTKRKTGTAVGDLVTGDAESGSGWSSAIVDFTSGMVAKTGAITGSGQYRTYSILDSSGKVIKIAPETATEQTVEMPYTADRSTNATTAGYYYFAMDKNARSVTKIIFYVRNQTNDTTVEYGVVDPSTGTITVWGEMTIAAGTNGICYVLVEKSKTAAQYVYLKASKDNLLCTSYKNNASYTGYYYNGGTSAVQMQTGWYIPYTVTYKGTPKAETHTIIAPTNAAKLIVNRLIAYGGNNTLYVYDNGTVSGGRGTYSIPNHLQPCVTCDWLLKLIQSQTGVSFQWSAAALAYINELAIPLIKRDADGQSMGGDFSATFADMTTNGEMTFTPSVTMPRMFDGSTVGVSATQLICTTAGTLTFEVTMLYSWDASTSTPSGTSSWHKNDGTTGKVSNYNYHGNYIQMTVTHYVNASVKSSEDPDVYYIGKQDPESLTLSTSDDLDPDKRFNFLLWGGGNVEVKQYDHITFEMKNQSGVLKGVKCNDGKISISLEEQDTVPYGGSFPIGVNLPDIRVLDFIKFLALVTGTFPLQTKANAIAVEFSEINKIWNNRTAALDWSERLIPNDATNKPRSTAYSIGDWCQSNWYKWKDDDTVFGNYDYNMKIANGTLEKTQDVWELPFAASDGNRVPFIEPYDGLTGTFMNATDATTDRNGDAGNYTACEPRIMTMQDNGDSAVSLTFGIDLTTIFNGKYANLVRVLTSPRCVTERLYLKETEIRDFDETIPVYFKQYGAYFAVTELKVTTDGYAEATMIQLTF